MNHQQIIVNHFVAKQHVLQQGAPVAAATQLGLLVNFQTKEKKRCQQRKENGGQALSVASMHRRVSRDRAVRLEQDDDDDDDDDYDDDDDDDDDIPALVLMVMVLNTEEPESRVFLLRLNRRMQLNSYFNHQMCRGPDQR
ncbi:hypothetical protein EYF80_039405 [Liparis tanakae]|uniref:Uncharacterized protein n=1 Tax=Liparis tanakae TaxID=230148 RepID=A0A4Z2GB01_9TELE|nr:hypothetical protein EYF80_039405 [Liparis tanakae]